ncbi:AP-3 complex subunit delta [Dispira parvispora]|uniref:AP-3 complex subunit delta n=1 Tax=Dispira parvispora TaxID=1520584 RepID=A0A9W8AUK9_9FUNG|nr:AP-3 complex subunit delta [Dispira parvispora]
MFEKTLTHLIRGIRANKHNEHQYLATCLDEIRKELQSNDLYLKYLAVSKLAYLHMLGYDASFAAFPVVEVMASPRFVYKRCGYLAAMLTFQPDTEVLMLCTNLFRKDLVAQPVPEIGLALDALAHMATPDLARDLCQDTLQLLHHKRPYIVKRATLALYKVFLNYPEAIQTGFPPLKELLQHSDPCVVSTVVNVICELARQNPRSYLSLAPHLYRLLTERNNNWMLIKIVKLFASLTPLEPRLAKKLVGPITALIVKTPAMSVLYECIHTAIVGGLIDVPTPPTVDYPKGTSPDSEDVPQLASLCSEKLRLFVQDTDHNLKYIGLLAMARLQAKYPRLVVNHRALVVKCLGDPDLSIRLRALDLLPGITTRKNLMDTVQRLMGQLTAGSGYESFATMTTADGSPLTAESQVTAVATTSATRSNGNPSTSYIDMPEYRMAVVSTILTMCSANTFANVVNFEWYLAVLVDLVYVAGVNVGEILNSQLLEVTVRVKSVREFAIKMMIRLLADQTLIETAVQPQANTRVLYAAAWAVGEYCDLHYSPTTTLQYLLNVTVRKVCSADIQAIYLQSIAKLVVYWAQRETRRLTQEDQRARTRTVGMTTMDVWEDQDKLAVDYSHSRWQRFFELLNTVRDTALHYAQTTVLEVRDRAVLVVAIVEELKRAQISTSSPSHLTSPVADLVAMSEYLGGLFFARDLNPVAPRAQSRVPVPPELTLDTWSNPNVGRVLEGYAALDPTTATQRTLNLVDKMDDRSALIDLADRGASTEHRRRRHGKRSKQARAAPAVPLCTPDHFPILVWDEEPFDHRSNSTQQSTDAVRKQKQRQQRERQRRDPFYISAYNPANGQAEGTLSENLPDDVSDVDQIPIVRLTLEDINPMCQSDVLAHRHKKAQRRHRRRTKHRDASHRRVSHGEQLTQHTSGSESDPQVDMAANSVVEFAQEEMPEGAVLTDTEGKGSAEGVAIPALSLSQASGTTTGKSNQETLESHPPTHSAPEPKNRKSRDSTKPRKKHRSRPSKQKDPGNTKHQEDSPTRKTVEPDHYLATARGWLTPVLCDGYGLHVTYQPRVVVNHDESLLFHPTGLGGLSPSEHVSHKVMVELILENRLSGDSLVDDVVFSFDSPSEKTTNPLFSRSAPLTVTSAHAVSNEFTVSEAIRHNETCTVRWEIQLHSPIGGAELQGTVQFRTGDKHHTLPWRLVLGPLLFITPVVHPCTPDALATILANPADFPYAGDLSIWIPVPFTESLESPAFSPILEFLATTLLGLQIVQVHGRAASLYGQTVYGFPIAVLVKVQPPPAQDGYEPTLVPPTFSQDNVEIIHSPVQDPLSSLGWVCPADIKQGSRMTIEVKTSNALFLTGVLDRVRQVFPSFNRQQRR